ncbi:MAG: hypothetical protein E7453_01165 [Ruminococcaceae bacterium]|nr:hypothetical protein [Oscillospiraceae bacterium]
MTNKKNTKKALVMSALSLVLCFSMLIGTTYAWFTDSVTSGVNTIQSGTLDIVLEYSTDGGNTWADAEGKTLNFKTADNRTTDILWEPGCTYELPMIRVRNNGNLALKYDIVINGVTGNAKLLEAIEFTANGNAITNFSGHLDATNAVSDSIVIKGHMKEEAGNEYQGLTLEGIGITVYATQYTYEQDSFDDQYDAFGTIFAAGITYINERYQINAELANVSGVKTLAMNVRDQNGKLITTVTPEGYQIPADGKITGLTMAAVVLGGDSSSWQNTPFVPSLSSIPTTAELVVNGTVVDITIIGKEHSVSWDEVVAAYGNATTRPLFASGIVHINGRYQICSEIDSISGVQTLALNIYDQNGRLITTVTPEGYQIPADGNINGLTMAAVVAGGDSSSWQNTPFVPSLSSVPTTAELVVNGVVIAVDAIGTQHGVPWTEAVAAYYAAN